jgi:predicted flap endonuclease-1-like 5' DNA nuclease
MGALVVIVVALIGVLLGYLIGKSSGNNSEDLQKELDKYRRKSDELSGELNALKAKSASGSHTLGFSSEPAVHEPFDAELASSVMEKKVVENDLKILEGVGPKIEELFKTSGIQSWKMLSETSVDRCNEILSKAGEGFAFHNPGTWPRQARLAYEGKWRDLKVWQDSLEGGVE